MTIRQVTIMLLVLTVFSLIGYDIFALVRGGNQSTISMVIYENSKNYPIISFAFGVLCGHLFWSQKRVD